MLISNSSQGLPDGEEVSQCSSYTSVADIEPVTILDISGNNLTSLLVLPVTLKYLYCNSNNLTSLPDLPSTLTHLSCGNNNLTSLPPLPNTLTHLYCGANNITSLPLLPPKLKILRCGYNNLTTLPLLPSTLTHLYCYNNNLPNWYDRSIDEIREQQIQEIVEKLQLLRKKIACRTIQRVWTRYWYYPNEECISRYSSYMSRVDMNR